MRQQHLVLLAAFAIVTTSSACTVIVDGTLQDRDSGIGIDVNLPDAFAPTQLCEMAAVEDGEFCTLEGSPEMRVCNENRCALSRCGDGLVDSRLEEACDDGNDETNDGCEVDCSLSCVEVVDCDDENPCTDEMCNDNICAYSDNAASCTVGGATSTCQAGVCPAANCGDGDIDSGEICDDGNDVSADGCERNCTPSCTEDAQCEDGVACNGVRTCTAAVAGARRCMEVTAPVACVDDGNMCTIESCVDGTGCVSDGATNDVDMDGHYKTSCGGDDCDDANPARHGGLVEVCGNRTDDDCSAATPDDTRTAYFADCDRDGFAASMAGSMLVCMAPASAPPACAGGTWSTVSPLNTTNTDCNGSNADVRPTQPGYFTTAIAGAAASRDFDYNCDGLESPQYPSGSTYFCTSSRAGCVGITHYATAPTCGVSNMVSRCTANRLTGVCTFVVSSATPVACR